MSQPALEPLAADVIAALIACPCDLDGEVCVRCECLIALAQACDCWQVEHLTGLPWAQVLRILQAPAATPQHQPLSCLASVGYTLLGVALQGLTLLCGVWVTLVYAWRKRARQ